MKKNLMILLLSLACIQCSHGTTKPEDAGAKAAVPTAHDLTRAQAQARAARLVGIQYEMSFNLPEREPNFTGTTTIHFTLKDPSQPLRIDFYNGKVSQVSVNGVDSTNFKYDGSAIEIPPVDLKEGSNTVAISYEHPYSTSGTGLHRFEDPEDHRIYTYTHFEPYDANQLFPCFDQPDLKAKYTIKAEVPATWQMISSTREKQVVDLKNGRKLWIFPQSQLFSTYLISLHGGPYKVWKSTAGSIPIRLFARQALAKYVNPADWFGPQKAGLKFYGNYFAYPYPFKKYDQVIAPNFNMGAMENVAAVTFSERYIRRSRPTREERERIASVILHEMAHMWFGDLVTMKWWNDLWLNESFATFMSAKSMAAATPFKESWQSFFLGDKQWAYSEDQYVTTHPIEAVVPDTDSAFANFDGITYGKGASVLKQLDFYLGEKSFQKGVQNYFKKYAFQSAELTDFIGALAESSHKDLSVWTRQWLQTAGLNNLSYNLQCQKGKIVSLTLTQGAPEGFPTLRDHRTKIGFFKKSKDGKMVLAKTVDVTYGASPVEVSEAQGLSCPAFIYPNVGDQDYVKVNLSPDDVTVVSSSLSDVSDSFARSMFWSSLWDMVRDSRYSVKDYADVVLKQWSREREPKIVNQIATTVYGGRYVLPNILLYLPRNTDQSRKDAQAYVEKYENLTWAKFKGEKNTDLQKSWFDAFSHIAQSPGAQEKLVALLDGRISVPGFQFDQDRRWNSIVQINTFNSPLGRLLTEQEKKRDPSNAGTMMIIASEAARPDLEAKNHWYNEITGSSSMPFTELRYAMWNLFPQSQAGLQEQFQNRFFKDLPGIVQTKSDDFQEGYSEHLAPNTCSGESVSELNKYIQSGPALTPIVLKNLKIARQEDQKCVQVRAFASRTGDSDSSH